MTTQTNATTGLTRAQVAAQTKAGAHNQPLKPLTRSVGQIIRQNTLTLFNFVNLALGALIITTGSYKNLLFLGVAIVNTAIGTIQEIRSKRRIDAMSILAETPATVLRDGQWQAIPQAALVLGDLLQLRRGAQVPVDGQVTATTGLEADESPLTGESHAISKQVGDPLLSGSFIVAGQATMQITAVGAETFAAKLALEAKAEKKSQSQLLATINRIIRVLTYTLIPLGVALFTVSMIRRGNYNRAILSTSAAMIGMIPEGLVLLTNVALAVSARNLAVKRVLVRALPAIEALARVDVICLDKTGTITSGALHVTGAHPTAGHTAAELTTAAAAVTYALNDDNETALAIKAAYPAPTATATATVPFSSARKWSGATFPEASLVIGAPEFLFPTGIPATAAPAIAHATEQGARVIAVARTEAALTPPLTGLDLLGWLTIADTVRDTAPATFRFFASQGVALKVISGDNPITVANVAKQAQLPGAAAALDMSTVADTADYHPLVRDYTVFGRVTPTQKQRLIAALQDDGHTVAMTGDGVNDVLALRQSDCGIAMASGAEAAKSIADFVLLDSNFDAMTGVLNEGRRVINNIERVASMYLVKTIFSVILTAIFVFLPLDYPITPINLTPVTAITVAIPSFFLTLEPNFDRVTGQFMQKVMTIAAPAALAIIGYTLVMTWFEAFFGWSFTTTSTLVVFMIGVIEAHVLILVSRPFNRYKLGMLIAVALAFFVTFFVVNGLFSLANLWRMDLMLVYLPALASTVPVYYFLQEFLGRRFLSKINWR
ncbi:HAD-IC family P-type ATPase [Lacticaseibacillus daqingensis]|uniref:HAD-IC family P-type ATPase n=1 Tax=Lacticaseibacillus daqingensis TaxID=2486014 RepID=UPI000F7A1C86|nr:HAD-IC family P-type ATPase [Lacticaseibacillus daqingensis]